MEVVLPTEVHTWLTEQKYLLKNVRCNEGPFSAAIYELEVGSLNGQSQSLVYKRCTASRQSEITLLQQTSSLISEYFPTLFLIVETPAEKGLLMVRHGVSLRAMAPTLRPQQRASRVLEAARWLGKMHVTLCDRMKASQTSSVLSHYPVEDARDWSAQTVNQLESHPDLRDAVGLTRLNQMHLWIDDLYSQFRSLLAEPQTVTHGDAHIGNILFDGATFKLIDWEFCCLAPAVRDLSILLQDTFEEEVRMTCVRAHYDELRSAGFPVHLDTFSRQFYACVLDNTMMMMGWDINQWQRGYFPQQAWYTRLEAKIAWMADAYQRLR